MGSDIPLPATAMVSDVLIRKPSARQQLVSWMAEKEDETFYKI